ncbi:MAG: hypothetical protein JXP34_04245 [Planctomycetes bacterium]|nr:hypothetical protein [Planctomycetota bacterium]
MKSLIAGIVLALASHGRGSEGPDRLFWHAVRLDEQGKLLSWLTSDSPYHDVVSRAWRTFERIPVQPNGFRTYITYPVFYGPNDPNHELFSGRSWTHNPASLFAMLTDGALLYYAYSGDARVLDRIREILDHPIARGSTSASDAWAGVPYASADAEDPDYRGATDTRYQVDGQYLGRGDGVGFIEPDKVGELGQAYARFYAVTLDGKYLDAARRCADALARHVRSGDESHSPWPFRVDARTGRIAREEYTAHTIGPIKLFDEMIRMEEGDVDAYRAARKTAWDWLMRYPVRNNVWTQYFEDIYIYPDYRTNINQYCPLETARYLLENPGRDPEWRRHAEGMIDWVRARFARDSTTMAGLPEKGVQWGAEAISEQVNDMDKMSSHTARYASVLALWYERTGDIDAKERAFRSFNWATYSCDGDGLVKTSLDEGTGYWFSDGYGDYMRHFQRGMASVPEWAPSDEDHLLRSSSVVSFVEYEPARIVYRTFHDDAEELVKLRRLPEAILADDVSLKRVPAGDGSPLGYTVEPVRRGGFAIRIRHRGAKRVTIRLGSR